jgi:hypothetical protein
MENKQITVNVPEGYIMKEEKTESGLILTFVKEEKADVEQEKVNFFRECLNGCIIRLEKDYPNSVFYDKEGKTMFKIENTNSGMLVFSVKRLLVWQVLERKWNMNYNDVQQFIQNQTETILKIKDARFIPTGELVPFRCGTRISGIIY